MICRRHREPSERLQPDGQWLCTRCKHPKKSTMFTPDRHTGTPRSWCRECIAKYNRIRKFHIRERARKTMFQHAPTRAIRESRWNTGQVTGGYTRMIGVDLEDDVNSEVDEWRLIWANIAVAQALRKRRRRVDAPPSDASLECARMLREHRAGTGWRWLYRQDYEQFEE